MSFSCTPYLYLFNPLYILIMKASKLHLVITNNHCFSSKYILCNPYNTRDINHQQFVITFVFIEHEKKTNQQVVYAKTNTRFRPAVTEQLISLCFRLTGRTLSYIHQKTNDLHMRKQGRSQLCSYCKADQRLCFRHTDSTYRPNFKLLASCCGCTAWFVSDLLLVGNLKYWVSHA